MMRRALPARRGHRLLTVKFRGKDYTVGYERYAEGGLAEVFVDSPKLASDAHNDARDIAVLISIAAQHGTPIATMRDALTRLDDNEPAGLAGCVLDALVAAEVDDVRCCA